MRRLTAAASMMTLCVSVVFAVPLRREPGVVVHVTPSAMSEQKGGTVEITEIIQAPGWLPLLSITTRAPGMTRAQPVEELVVTDGKGTVEGTLQKNDEDGTFVWTGSRHTTGAVTVRYRLPVINDNRAGGGPPTYLRIDGDTISGEGGMLFLQPRLEGPYRIAIDWNLEAMGAGAQAVSTYGDGNVALAAGSASRLVESFYMAGHLQRYSPPGSTTFSGVWGGHPEFDPKVPLQWSATLYEWMSHFFGDTVEPQYRIFLRYNPASNAGGGAAYPYSYLWTFGEGVAADHMESILGHEMTHTWTAGVSKWFDEGIAVYYQQLLPWLAGMISTDDYLRDINKTAARYYTNELINMPDAEVMQAYWSDVRRIVIPYDRGAIYFAAVDQNIRRASHGERSLDDLIRVIVAKLRDGQQLNEKTWSDLVQQELGSPGVDAYHAMLDGKTIVPASSAYGRCFRRVDAMIRRYDLGLHVKKPVGEGPSIVEGLKPGSEAERAGIRNGDEIVLRTNTDGAQRDPDMRLTVKITRDGRTFPVTYLPRAEPVKGYQWERDAGVAEGDCRPR